VLPEAVGDRFPGGLVVTTDDENTDPEDSTNFKLASWSDILGAAGQSTDVAALPARRENVAVDGDSPIASVVAAVETVPVPSGADAADDPAIYIHPSDPGLHAVIGTDKTGALVVYGLDGGVRQELQVGRVNNVDVRDGFDVGGVPRTLVAASNRTDNTLGFWLVDEATGMLEAAGGEPVVSAVREVYGFCLYQQPDTGAVFAFVNSSGTGDVEQYAVAASADGAVTAELVRSFSLGTQTEGCVADDELRAFYVGEEDAGIWKYGADPDAGEERTLIDATQPDGNLVADVEGLAIAKGEGEDGYLIASSQGESLFAVYERGGDNDFLGKFRIVDGEGIDAVSGTDGIEVTTRALPAPFEGGLFVAQDDVNREPFENQNFKLVRWQDVVDAMGLE
jgi:3-phytase